MNEFGLIEKYFAPLSRGEKGAFALQDDAAVIKISAPGNMVITQDAIVEGVHFLADTDPALIAKKLLRVNVSDLLAKGARPAYYLLSATFRKDTAEEWIAKFASGLRADQKVFGMKLIGGDTTSTTGPMVFSLTAIGEAGKPVLRSKAKVGDTIYVTGAIGDAYLGLRLLKNEIEGVKDIHRKALTERYHLPEPRTLVGMHLPRVASAAIDISDGLVADVRHLCETSGVAGVIKAAEVPVSRAGKALLKDKKAELAELLGGGDDYEIAFTAPKAKAPLIDELAAFAGVKITAIGEVAKGKGVWVVDAKGRPVAVQKQGFQHF